MFHKKVAQYPLWAWILAAMSAPVAQLAAWGPWLSVLALAIVCGGLCWGIHALSGEQTVQWRWYCCLEYLFLILITGKFAQMAADSWPTGNSFPTVSLTLLILAATSALDGVDRASRIGVVLFWLLALLYAVILGAGAKDLHIQWLSPSLETPRGFLAVIFLIPAATSFLPREKGRASTGAIIIMCVFTAIVSLWTAGTMSQTVVGGVRDPFYEYSKSLSLFGVAERFEAFVSVALTLSYFALLSFLFSVAGHLAEAVRPGWGRTGVITCAAVAACVLLCPPIPELWLALLAVILWGALPLLTQFARMKKSKNFEKGS